MLSTRKTKKQKKKEVPLGQSRAAALQALRDGLGADGCAEHDAACDVDLLPSHLKQDLAVLGRAKAGVPLRRHIENPGGSTRPSLAEENYQTERLIWPLFVVLFFTEEDINCLSV